jgi:hypothetical protein
MRETNTRIDSDGDHFQLQALLYAAGELEGAELSRFEKRLGEDQEAREALCQTMGITLALSGRVPATPHPAYRELVRARLFPSQPFWQSWVWPGGKWTHPAIWTVAALLGVLLVLGVTHPPWGKGPDIEPNRATADSAQGGHRGATQDEGARPLPSPEAATFWSELSNSEHLSKARDEEFRRRGRVQEFQSLSRSKLGSIKSGAQPAVPTMK